MQLGLALGKVTAIAFAAPGVTTVDAEEPAAISDAITTRRRQFRLQRIVDIDNDHIIVTGELRQMGGGRRIEAGEIAE
jgi:hypothetical protein